MNRQTRLLCLYDDFNRRSQSLGSNAETVNNPNGGNAHRLPSNRP